MEKLVIFDHCNILAVTTEDNYNNRIMDERKITLCRDFSSPDEIIEYYCKYFNCVPADFIILV